jgi:hypothetical protein
VDEKYLFEIGGRAKNFKQIADMKNRCVIADEEETYTGNRLPMWLPGFLY